MRLCGSILCLSILGLVQCSDASECAPHHPVYEAVQEWEVWKATHSKRYDSMREELEKHIVWHSNRVLIEQHNRNTKLGFYSYQVKLNHLGDLVRYYGNCRQRLYQDHGPGRGGGAGRCPHPIDD